MKQTRNVASEITASLQELKPTTLEVENDSARHHGHAGDNGTGQTHFIITISSPEFAGLSRLQKHQLVYGKLNHLMPKPIHALELKII